MLASPLTYACVHLRLHARRCGTGEPHFGPGAGQTTVLESRLRDPVRGADGDLRLTCEPHRYDPRAFPGPVPQRPASGLGTLSPLPVSWPAQANRWHHVGWPQKQPRGGLELGPTGQSRRGGPAGLSDRSGAQAGIEPAVATDTASLSSAPPGRYRMSTPVHCRCERHPDACWRLFGIATQSRNLSGPPLGIEPGERRHPTGLASHSAEAQIRTFRWSRRFGQRNGTGERGRRPSGHRARPITEGTGGSAPAWAGQPCPHSCIIGDVPPCGRAPSPSRVRVSRWVKVTFASK